MKTKPFPRLTVALTLLALFSATAQAADLVWTGASGQWNLAGNWSPAQVPGAADNAFITNSGPYTVTVPDSVNPTIGSLTLGGDNGPQILSLGRSILTLNGASVVNPNGQLVLTVPNSTLTGPGAITVNGTLIWTAGTMSGAGLTSIGSGGTLAINGNATLTGRTLNNAGAATWNAGNLTAGSGAVINNQAGATFDVTFDGRFNVATAPATVNNAGLFRKTIGAVSTIINAPFNNSGTLQVLAAILSLDGGGTHSGTINSAAGATLNFGGGTHSLGAGSFVTGAGAVGVSGGATVLTASGAFNPAGSTLNLASGTATLSAGCDVTGTTLNIGGGVLNFNSSGTVAAVNLTAGTLGGTSTVTVTGPLTLGGGTVTNALVRANGGLTINGNVTLNGGKLVNPGAAVWSAGNFNAANGAVFSNLFGATFTTTFDGNINVTGATPLFVNAGTFRKTDGTAALGTTSIDSQFINAGTVEVQTNTLRLAINQQTSGLTLLDGGGLTAQAQPFQLLGGTLMGTGLVTVANNQNVINSAKLSPGLPLGELDITGNYQQTASGALNIELGGYSPGSGFDLVTVTAGGAGGIATLGGALNITLTNGFSPTNGATFTFLTALSRVGTFATFNYPSNDIGMQLIYDTTNVTLKVTNLKPVVANPIVDPVPATYGVGFNFQFAANTFTDPDNNLLNYTAAGMPPGITFVGATRTFSGIPTQAGVFPVVVIANDNGSPSLSATNVFNITVNPATLIITADPINKGYGTADPPLTYAVSGLKFSDTPASVLTGALSRVAGENVAGSPYPISQGSLVANSNYTINFTGNMLSITPVALTVTANAKTKTYGTTDPPFTANYSGFVNGETAAVLSGTLTLSRNPGENVGSYPITPAGLTSANYAITFNNGTLAITKATLSVTADAKTKTYGTTDPPFTASYAGFANGETAAVLGGTLTFSRISGESVGSYPITPTGLSSPNYTITFNAGTLTITAPAHVVLSISRIATGQVMLTWNAVSNATYRVQYKAQLNATTWTDLIGDVLAVDSTASKTDIFTETTRFYRVQVLP